jgi:glycosyltransferase involved in cell wall biosynthesis
MNQRAAPVTVSVALCTYNGQRFLQEQLDTIASQSVLPHELVVGDDRSSDGTREMLARFAADAPFDVRVIERPVNIGTSANFADTLAQTRGELIVLADQDDRWRVDKLERTLESFTQRPELLVVFSNARLVDANGASLGKTLFESLGISRDERTRVANGHAFDALIRRNIATGATMTVRRSLVDLALPIGAEWIQDEWLAMIAATLDGTRLAMIDDPLIDYRQHAANQIGAKPLTRGELVAKLFAARDDHCPRLLRRTERLIEKVESLGAAVTSDKTIALREKVEHLRLRTALPSSRWLRVAPIAMEIVSGRYARFSTGARAVARDLFAPA